MKDRRGDVVNVYKRVTAIIFQRMGPTFGSRTIAAIAKNALARQGKRHPVLAYLTVSDKGIDWSQFDSHVNEVSEEEVSAGLEDFLDEFFEALSNLIGRLVLGQIFREAEEMTKRGESQ